MNKCLYIVQHFVDNKTGIGQKIIAQCEALTRAGIVTELCSLDLDENCKYSGRIVAGALIEEFTDILFVKKKYTWLWRYSEIEEYMMRNGINIVYIRYSHFANPFLIYFLHRIKKRDVKVYMEVPTYPYDAEYAALDFKRHLHLGLERFCRKFLFFYLRKVITFSDHNKIFGVETIRINNGIDVGKLKLATPPIKNSNHIDIIVVSSLEFWHGYDRLIAGYFNYIQCSSEVEITIHFAGPINSELQQKYAAEINEKQLNSNIVFHGYLSGRELDALFDVCDIAVGVLGGHRKGLNKLSALKCREYCARGVPFIYSGIDEAFDGKNFALCLPSNDEPIDLNLVIEWLNFNVIDRNEMRNFALLNLTWDHQFAPLIAELL